MTNGLDGRVPSRGRHRVTLELEVEEDAELAEPEDWDLQHLSAALLTGLARPLRTIRGLVVDTEHDRLSHTLNAIADDIDESVQLHWMASAEPWPKSACAPSVRPSLATLITLEHHAAETRRIAEQLRLEGL
jgi:hypothetical protein